MSLYISVCSWEVEFLSGVQENLIASGEIRMAAVFQQSEKSKI